MTQASTNREHGAPQTHKWEAHQFHCAHFAQIAV